MIIVLFLIATLCTGLSQVPAVVALGPWSMVFSIAGYGISLFSPTFKAINSVPKEWAGRFALFGMICAFAAQTLAQQPGHWHGVLLGVVTAALALLGNAFAGLAKPSDVPIVAGMVAKKKNDGPNLPPGVLGIFALIFVTAQSGCAHLPKPITDYSQCLTGDLGNQVSQILPVVEADLANGNYLGLLTDLGTRFGYGVVDCAVSVIMNNAKAGPLAPGRADVVTHGTSWLGR